MNTMILDGLTPRSRSTDPVTSVDAGRVADLKGSQAMVLDVFRHPQFPAELTQGELEVLTPGGWSASRIRSAVSELVELGLLEWTGETRPTQYGRQARVYRAT